MQVMAHLGLDVPEPPSFDDSVQNILQTYYYASRGRRYVEGHPLPISVKDVTDVVYAHPISMSRSMLDPIIFAIDDIVLSEQREQAKMKDVSSDS